MSNDEKLIQIGRATVDAKQARVDLAHHVQKLREIGKAYRQVGVALAEAADGRKAILAGGRIFTGHGPERAETRWLLSEANLIRALEEFEAAKEAAHSAALRLAQLGHSLD